MAALAGPTDTITVRVTFCDSITWHEVTYHQDTVATYLVSHESGNDTLYMLYLHLNYSTRTDFYDTACGVYYWKGGTYTESGEYYVHHQAANGCDSAEVLHLTMRPGPEQAAIVGDTLVCRNQYAVLSYPVADTNQFRYEWYFGDSLVAVNRSRITWLCPADGGYNDSVALFRMAVSDKFSDCTADTASRVNILAFESPARSEVVRKENSNILVCNPVNDAGVHYRWGVTDKYTAAESVYDWDYNYFQYDLPINTDLYDYWVETYRTYGDVSCRNRAYYEEGTVTFVPEYDTFSALAVAQGDWLQIRVENPTQQSMYAVLRDVSGRTVAQYSLGTASFVHHTAPFPYANGIYLLSFYAGNQCLTIKIAK